MTGRSPRKTANICTSDEGDRLGPLDYYRIDPATRAERDRLFTLIGPLFASRQVRREMPYMHHEEDFVWFVAVTSDGDAAGMASIHIRSAVATLRNLYVVPAHRGRGIAATITERQLAYASEHGARWIRTVASPFSVGAYEKRGFYRVGSRGKYVTMEIAL